MTMQRWRDRQAFGVVFIAGHLTFAAYTLLHTGRTDFWYLSIILGLSAMVVYAALRQILPSVRRSPRALFVRNTHCTYGIPWGQITSVAWNHYLGLHLTLNGGDKPIVVEAFSAWPAFGRHLRIRDELERERQRFAADSAGEDLRKIPSKGYWGWHW
ncbi:hypothetical protein [Streptomyces sp. YIM S03343]